MRLSAPFLYFQIQAEHPLEDDHQVNIKPARHVKIGLAYIGVGLIGVFSTANYVLSSMFLAYGVSFILFPMIFHPSETEISERQERAMNKPLRLSSVPVPWYYRITFLIGLAAATCVVFFVAS